MEWTDEHGILLHEMIASELLQFKKDSPDRGKIWESIHERLKKLYNPQLMIKEKRGVRDQWNQLQTKFNTLSEKSFKLVASIVSCPKRMHS